MEKPRLYFIDNLRILLITLVAILHLAITYGSGGSWYYRDVPEGYMSIPMTWQTLTIQSFSMGLFFLVSGYFTPGSYDRKGPRQFLKDRLLRLGIPILCYDYLIGPLMAYPLMKVGALEQAGTLQFKGSYTRFLSIYYSRLHIGTGPLWFVEALLIFAGFYVLWRVLSKIPARSVQDSGKLPGNLAIAIFAFALCVVTFIVRIWLPIGWSFEPLNFQFPFFPQYICMFIVGIAAYKRNWLARIPDAMGKLWLTVAVILIFILFPVLFVLGGATSGDVSSFIGGFNWQSFALAAWEQFTGVAMIIALLFLFRKRFNRQGNISKAMSAGAYTAYIIHAPVVVLVAIAIRNISLYPLLKFALAVLISVPLCFALANFIRQLPLARRIL
ncbi:MAG: acyltransferase family protein [Planctomycetota bacterium]|jgi:surface polysaccharide O-acyltransferase-like enzyme